MSEIVARAEAEFVEEAEEEVAEEEASEEADAEAEAEARGATRIRRRGGLETAVEEAPTIPERRGRGDRPPTPDAKRRSGG